MRTIYTINAQDHMLLSVMKDVNHLSDEDVYREIWTAFDSLVARLTMKGIPYDDLKNALIPNQEKKYDETCLVIDTSLIEDDHYVTVIFEKLFPLLGKDGTYSILCGDYIDVSNDHSYQPQMHSMLSEAVYRCHESKYRDSNQYFIVYFNRLTKTQRTRIVEGLYPYPWFTGFSYLNNCPEWKTYLSFILSPYCIKCKQKIIVPHPADCDDTENVNERGLPLQENGFELISINEDGFGIFLSYKIMGILPDPDDVGFSFNALFPKFDSIDQLKLVIADKKWSRYLISDEGSGKGRILKTAGYHQEEKERFMRDIYQRVCSSYIYNLRKNDYEALLFDVCIELPMTNDGKRKTVVGLKYDPESGTVEVVTIT